MYNQLRCGIYWSICIGNYTKHFFCNFGLENPIAQPEIAIYAFNCMRSSPVNFCDDINLTLIFMQHTSLSPDGKLLVIVGDDPEGMLVDSRTGKVYEFFLAPQGDVLSNVH